MSDLKTDSTTRWLYSYVAGHMGYCYTPYKYSSDAVKTSYSGYVNTGKGLWGGNINAAEQTETTEGVIKAVTDITTDATAYTSGKTTNSNGHYTGWSITIIKNNFDRNAEAGKNRTLAHEFGHVYGLGDLSLSYSSQIMYGTYSATKSVTAADTWGMKVVTHAHTHGSNSTYTYTSIDSSNHKKRCNECNGYFEEVHTFTYVGTGNYLCAKCGYYK